MRTRRPITVQARLRQCTGRSRVLRRLAIPSDPDPARASTDPGVALFFERLGAALFYGDPHLHDADLH
jgi:hypothetical protein